MNLRRELFTWMAGLALLASAPATAQTWSLTVGANQAVTTDDLNRNSNVIMADHATVQVTCTENGITCSDVGLQLENSGTLVQKLGRSPANSDTFQVAAGIVKSKGPVLNLVVTFKGSMIDSFPVTTADAGNGGNGDNGGNTANANNSANTASSAATAVDALNAPSLAELLATSCKASPVSYDPGNNRGTIVVTPVGNVLARGVDTFDENDQLKVIVAGDVRLLPLLKVERISTFRDVQTVRIVGAGVDTSKIFQRQGAGICGTVEFEIGDFAPGQGKVQISVFQKEDWLPLGTFDFNVDPLYTGILSAGAAWSDMLDPEYKLASNGTETVIAVGQDGDSELLYTLFYTPYLWGKRDLEKKIPWRQFYKHINLTFGIVPQDIDENALVGLTVDLPAGLLFTYGRHFRRVTVLPEDTGLTVGSPFTGTLDQLPTAKSWEDETFFALTVDLRAMVQLFTAAVSGGGGS